MRDKCFSKTDYYYRGICTRVVDGDTVHLMIDLGFRSFISIGCRLDGINAPEKTGPNKADGIAAMNFLDGILKDQNLIIRTFKMKEKDHAREKQGSFSRWLVEIYIENTIVSVNDAMVQNGYAEYKEY